MIFKKGKRIALIQFHLGPAAQHTVYEAERAAMALGVFSIKNKRNVKSVTINVDNQAAILASTDIKQGPGKYILDIFHEQVAALKHRNDNVKLKIRWTPGHVGIEGNEEADEAAKAASAGTSSPRTALPKPFRKPLPTSKSAAKQQFNSKVKEAALEAWRIAPQAKKLKGIINDAGGKKYRKALAKADRRTGSLWMQLKTGHIGLNAHLHRIKISKTAACPGCKQYNETVDHLLRHCHTYDELRSQLRRTVKRDMTELKKLLGNDSNMTHVAEFVRKTKRIGWMLKQDKRPSTAQGNLFNGYTGNTPQACQRHRAAPREHSTQSRRGHTRRDSAERGVGQITYPRGDIRNWLIAGNKGGAEGDGQRGIVRAERDGPGNRAGEKGTGAGRGAR